MDIKKNITQHTPTHNNKHNHKINTEKKWLQPNWFTTADLQHYIPRLRESPNSGWLEDLICMTITIKNGFLSRPQYAQPSSPWLTPHTQPAPRISIRIEITVKIHMLQLARLVDLLHPGHQTDLFCQGKQLLTWKVDKHLNLFLSCYGIGHPKGTYQSPTVNVNSTFTAGGAEITRARTWRWAQVRRRRTGLSRPFSAQNYQVHHKIPSSASAQALLVQGIATAR